MNESEKQIILEKAKQFFRDKIVENHKRNTLKLKKLSAFQPNPFLDKYLANFAYGSSTPKDIAKVLIYPRVLGTSINTTFGTQLQSFCSDVLSGYASLVSGIDIEFEDQLDGRRKYCQIKAGPNTINKDDIKTIKDHFIGIKNLAKTNRIKDFNAGTDCIVGVFYGRNSDLSSSYRTINKDFPVYVGKEFWLRLTGDENFYFELINTFAEVADDINGTDFLEETLTSLADDIAGNYNA